MTEPGKDDRGEAMVVLCLMIAVLLLPIGGLSVDLWRALSEQRALQAQAEDAALAGASGINVPAYRESGCVELQPSLAEDLATVNLAEQARAGRLKSVQIIVSTASDTITVRLTESLQLSLLRLALGNRQMAVSAAATSGPIASVSQGYCS